MHGGQSAIDSDDLAGDPALFGVEKPRDGAGDFMRPRGWSAALALREVSFLVSDLVSGVRVRLGATQLTRML